MPVLVPGKVFRDKIDSNQRLWRYMDLPMFMEMIEHRSLFFTRADRFEDRYEGAFTPTLKERIENSFRDNGIPSSFDEFKTKLRERVFISCWHKGIHDNMAMWKIYGAPATGVAITTWVKRLEEALIKHKNYRISETYIFDVKYINHWHNPSIDIKPYSRIFSYKLKAYTYENEIRAVIDTLHHTYDVNPPDEYGLKVDVDVEKLIRSIVISPNAPKWFIELIHDIVERYGLKIPVRRSKLSFEPL
jgi:hypothetical protein